MTYLLFEKPFIPVAILVADAMVFRVLWTRTEKPQMRNLCFVCFGLAVVWMGMALLVKTPRERLLAQCQQMAKELAVLDFDTAERMLNDPVDFSLASRPITPRESVRLIEEAVKEFNITSITIRARRVEIDPETSLATVRINVTCTSDTTPMALMVWVLSLEDRDGWWVITDAEGYAPTEGPEAE